MAGSTIREIVRGKMTLRLVKSGTGYQGVILPPTGGRIGPFHDTDPERLWRRLEDESGKAGANYIGFDGARARFLHFFPEGFAGSGYAEWERNYKVAAQNRLNEMAPFADAAIGSGFGEAVLSVFQATNLLSMYEKARLSGTLRGASADTFVRAAARFAQGEGEPALLDMRRILQAEDNAKWTVVTYLPFLWRSDAHMFLKPEVTKDFARRVGHRFADDYDARVHITVYGSLLDLVRETKNKLADLHPRDGIDVQSFIWVVGGYKDADAPPGSRGSGEEAGNS